MDDSLSASETGPFNRDILIVEDDVAQCEELADFFGRAGLMVQVAHTPSSALELTAWCRPRVSLLDYNLPEMTGLELAEQLRAVLPDTSIIMMSGRIAALSELTMAKLGINVFLNKPLPLRALQQAVLRLVKLGLVDRTSGLRH